MTGLLCLIFYCSTWVPKEPELATLKSQKRLQSLREYIPQNVRQKAIYFALSMDTPLYFLWISNLSPALRLIASQLNGVCKFSLNSISIFRQENRAIFSPRQPCTSSRSSHSEWDPSNPSLTCRRLRRSLTWHRFFFNRYIWSYTIRNPYSGKYLIRV